MDADETSAYVGRIQRRRRAVHIAWVAFAVAVTAGVAMLSFWGDDWACHYGISRENYGVPDLTGLQVEEARELLPTCVELVTADAPSTDDPDARIVSQDPEPPQVLDHRRSIEVVLAPAG